MMGKYEHNAERIFLVQNKEIKVSIMNRIIAYVLDCFLISLCLYGALYGLLSSIKAEIYWDKSLFVAVGIIFSCRFLYGIIHKKYYVSVILLAIMIFLLYWYQQELYYGLLYWLNCFLDFYNDYYNQSVYIKIPYTGNEEYYSMILMYAMVYFLSSLIAWAQSKGKLLKMALILPFLIFILPFTVGLVHKEQFMITFFAGTLPLSCKIRSLKVLNRIQIKVAVGVCFGIAMIGCFSFFPRSQYHKIYPDINEKKQAFKRYMQSSELNDLTYLLLEDYEWLPYFSIGGGGVQNGKIGNLDKATYDNKTDFRLIWPNYDNLTGSIKENPQKLESGSIYLKDYLGIHYHNGRWSDLTKNELGTYQSLCKSYEDNFESLPKEFYDLSIKTGKQFGITNNASIQNYKVEKVRIPKSRTLVSYGSESEIGIHNQHFFAKNIVKKKNYWDRFNVLLNGNVLTGNTFGNQVVLLGGISYPEMLVKDQIIEDKMLNNSLNFNNKEKNYRDFVYDVYTKSDSQIAPKLKEHIEDDPIIAEMKIRNRNNYDYDRYYYSYIFNKIKECKAVLWNNADYSLEPGKTPKGKDVIDYFLFENHKGYCTYFATAAVIYFRKSGIPCRYVEGYCIKDSELRKAKKVKIKYEIQATDCYRINVTDKSAHAWIEIYVNGYGWVPIEVTPADLSKNDKSELSNESSKPAHSFTPFEPPIQSPDSGILQEDKANNQQLQKWESYQMKMSKLLVGIFSILMMVFLFIIFRYSYLKILQIKERNNKERNKRAKYYYKTVNRKLKSLCGLNDDKELSALINHICYVSKDIKEVELREFIYISEKAAFGSGDISEEECIKVKNFSDNVDNLFYKRLSICKKVYYRIWKVY